MSNARRDGNFVPAMQGVSSVDGSTPTNIHVDPVTNAMIVEIENTASIGAGTEYTEGDTDATITGKAVLVEGAANALAVMTQPLTDTQLRATAVPISVATIPSHAVTNAGTFAVQVTSAPSTTVTATDLDIRPLVNTDVVTAELSAVDNAVLDTIAAKDFATQTTLADINTKLVTGTDIGDVTINNSTGAAAVNIQDGGNTITVDGTVAVTNAGITTIAGAVAGTEMQVDVLTLPAVDLGANNDVTVTNATATNLKAEVVGTGTFVTQSTLAAETTKVIGTVNIAAAQTLATVTTVGAVTAITNALPAGTNAIGKLAANSGVDIGDVDVTSIAAGTNTIGAVNVKPTTSGGLDIFRSIDLDESEEEVKATAGQVFGWYIYNKAAAVTYVKFYNATAANTTVGTTTPVMTVPIPATAGANVEFTNGITFSTAITVAATTGVADADTGAPAANDLIINLLYK